MDALKCLVLGAWSWLYDMMMISNQQYEVSYEANHNKYEKQNTLCIRIALQLVLRSQMRMYPCDTWDSDDTAVHTHARSS